MEQSKVCVTTSRKFSDELSAVYEHIDTYLNRTNSEDKQASKGKFRDVAPIATTFTAIVMGGVYAGLSFLPDSTWGDSTEEIRLVFKLIVLLIYIMGGVSALLQYFSFKDIFGRATKVLNF